MLQVGLTPARYRRALELLPALFSIAVAAIALLVLVCWTFEIDSLRHLLYGGGVEMNPTTAICFVLSAVALWVLRKGRWSSNVEATVARVCSGIVLLVAVTRLGAYAGLWSFHPDVFIFASRLRENMIAPNTAFAFLLISSATLLLDAKPIGRFHIAQPLTLVTIAIAGLSLVGYAYQIASLYGVRGAIAMSLITAIEFLLLSVGTLCARLEREPVATLLSPTLGGVVARRLLPGAFLIPLLLGALLLKGVSHGWYEAPFGMMLFVLAVIAVFNGLIWWSARVIRKTDLKRQRAAEELSLNEQRYRAIMRNTAEGIYLVDLESSRIVETNLALEEMLGYTADELKDRPVADLINDRPEAVLVRLRALKTAHRPLQGERQYRRKDGSVIEMYVGATAFSYGGREVACTILHDITERKKAHQLLQEKHDQLEQAVAAEREAMEKLRMAQSALVQNEKLASLGQMVAGVAHEINNPLAFVSNNVAVLQRDTRGLCQLIELYARADELLSKNNPELLQEIRELAERMDLAYTQANLATMMTRSRDGLKRIQQIVKDLRDFARLDESDLHEVDLNNGIESTINIISGRAKKKRVEICTDLGSLPMVTCFPAKLNQVVMNLVANAIDACPEGGKVTIRTGAQNDRVRIDVSDNGPGVPPAIRQRIFDPFFTTKPQGEGTGLGLSISYGIVKDHGGDIDLTDAPGGGAMFSVTVPKTAPPPPQRQHAS